MKVWFRIPIQVDPIQDDPERSKGRVPRSYLVAIRLPYPPTVGLQIINAPNVPFVSVPPVTNVLFNCTTNKYTCHTEPFTYSCIDNYNAGIEQLDEFVKANTRKAGTQVKNG